jgi:hypothetical protein
MVTIVRQPVSWVVREGGEFKMRCRAKVTPQQPLLYQWLRNKKPLPNETSPELTCCVLISGSAIYHCEVKTVDGRVSVLSESAYTEPAPTHRPASTGQAHNYAEAEQKLLTLSKERYAREKVALLVGNQKYDCPDLNKLQCTEEEVRRVAEKLTQLHFKVFTFLNLRLSEMKEVLTWFYSLLSAGVYGLFYYSGHGFNVNNISYLMPVDLQSGEPRTNTCIGSDSVAHHMQKTLCRAVIVLDCCQVLQNGRRDSMQAETPYEVLNIGNLMEIHSTSRGQVAYEGSKFSTAFIAALDSNGNVGTLNSEILHKMREGGDSATPCSNGSMSDSISLKDPIMRDSMKKEEEAERLCDVAEAIQAVPGPVTLEGGCLGALAGLLSLRLSCSAQFTNGLALQVVVNLKQVQSTPSVQLNMDSLRGQGVEAEVLNTPDDPLCYKVMVTNTQRLKEPLCLPVTVTVSVPDSGDKSEDIRHTFPGPTLNSLLSSTT